MNEYCGDKNIGEKFVIKNIIKEIYFIYTGCPEITG